MAGYTDTAMRTLCLEQGAGAVYTELISAEGLRRDSLNTFQMLETARGEHPIAGHLFGSDPDAMADAAEYVEQTGRFDWIDINCGCPVKKVVSRGAGAALLRDLPLMGKIIERVKHAVSLPVSVKTRIGFSGEAPDHLEIARAVEQSGADMIAVHARLARQFHGGEPDWERLGEMEEALHIPILGNGGIQMPADAQRMAERTGVDGIMIGRAAIGNPWIFDQIRKDWQGACSPGHRTAGPPSSNMQKRSASSPVTPAMRRDMMAEHLRRLVELNRIRQQTVKQNGRFSPEQAACIQFRTHIPYYVKGMFDKKQLLMKLAHLMTVDAIMEEVDRLVEKNKREA